MSVDDDATMTEAEIDELFERTQPIGNALNALYRAEQIMAEAVVGETPPEIQARLDRISRDLLDD